MPTAAPPTSAGSSGPPWPGDRGGHLWPKDREVLSSDGTAIRYTVLGDAGPWVALCPGFMCPDNFWAGLAPALAERHRVLVLNYRSIGASEDPRPAGYRGTNLRAEDYTIERLAEDVAAVVHAEGATGVTLVGHSMGCQVAFATYDLLRAPTVAACVLVTGSYRSPLRDFYGRDLGAVVTPLYWAAHMAARPVQRAVPRALRLPIALPVARLIRALGDAVPDDGMDLYFEHFPRVDPLIALRFLKGMHEYDATDLMPEVTVPVLVVVGSEDTFTPPSLGRDMLAALPRAELVEVVGGSHGAIIEYPRLVHDAVADFLARHVDGPEHEPVEDTSGRLRREVRVADVGQ